MTCLSEDDIPVLVSLIVRGDVKDGMRSIAFGVLGKFGAEALPCIEAVLTDGRAQGATDLSTIKINIEAELRSPPGVQKGAYLGKNPTDGIALGKP